MHHKFKSSLIAHPSIKMASTSSSIIVALPIEIQTNILEILHWTDHLAVRLTCKLWNTIASSPSRFPSPHDRYSSRHDYKFGQLRPFPFLLHKVLLDEYIGVWEVPKEIMPENCVAYEINNDDELQNIIRQCLSQSDDETPFPILPSARRKHTIIPSEMYKKIQPYAKDPVLLCRKPKDEVDEENITKKVELHWLLLNKDDGAPADEKWFAGMLELKRSSPAVGTTNVNTDTENAYYPYFVDLSTSMTVEEFAESFLKVLWEIPFLRGGNVRMARENPRRGPARDGQKAPPGLSIEPEKIRVCPTYETGFEKPRQSGRFGLSLDSLG